MPSGITDSGTLPLSSTTRLKATKYTADAYRAAFLKPLESAPQPLRSIPTYLDSADSEDDGNEVEAERWQKDLKALSLDLNVAEEKVVQSFWTPARSWSDVQDLYPDPSHPVPLILQKLRYSTRDTRYSSNETDASHYGRAWYNAGLHSTVGGVLGHMGLNPDSVSTIDRPILDAAIRSNFGTVSLPQTGRSYSTTQQGVLNMADPKLPIDPTSSTLPVYYTAAANDSFVLGLIHGNNPIYLASPRAPEDVSMADGSGLRVAGKEYAMVMGSGAYELHTHPMLGEAFVPVGAAKGARYDLSDALQQVELATFPGPNRESLSWLSNIGESLEAGEVVVQAMETLVDDRWMTARKMNELEGRR